MKRNILISLFLIICVLFSTIVLQKTNITATTNASKHINVVLGSEPSTLDPALSLTIDVRSYLSHLFEGLTVLDSEGNVMPGVAKKWFSNDNATLYTFQIRDDAKWNDGTQVKAEDFKYAWLRVLAPETASGWASFLYYIKGAERYNTGVANSDDVGIFVGSDGSLVVELENPCAFFPSMTAMQPFYPVRKDIIEHYKDDWSLSSETFVTNGAYSLSTWKHDQILNIKKSEVYWNATERGYNSISFILLDDSSAVMNAYENGEVDFVENVLSSIEMEQVGTVHSADFTVTKFLSLNSKREVFSDIRVREAIAIAIDRDMLAKLLGENYRALCSWVPYGFINLETGYDFRQESNKEFYIASVSNIEKARYLMEKAGYPMGKGFPTLEYLTNTSSLNVKLAEIVKEQLMQIGITVNVKTYESKVFNEYRANRDFDIVAASWAAEYPDISSYFYGFQSSDINNYASFHSEEYDGLYKAALATSGLSERFRLYIEQEELIMNSWYVLPLYSNRTSFVVDDKIKGYFHDVTGCLNFNMAW